MKRVLLLLLLSLSLTILGGEGGIDLEVVKTEIRYKIERQAEFEKRNDLINALMWVESRHNPLAYNPGEEAAGVLQIRPVMLREINRLLGYEKYSLKDRWDKQKSIEMFIDLQTYIQGDNWDLELAARTWNGGYTGMKKVATSFYWNLVKNRIEVNNLNKKKDGAKIFM